MFDVFEKNESEVRSYCRKYPVVFSKAKNAEMYSADGQRYIDFLAVAGSMNYGHNNPEIKKKILEYLSEDNIINSLDMYTEAKELFFEKFISGILKPRNLDYKIMCCGPTGTNAVEAALKLARKYTGRRNVIAFGGAFHGMTLGSLALTTDRKSRMGGGVSLNDVTFAPYDGTMGVDALKYLKWIVTDDHSGVDKPAAIVLETIQAEGGINVASIKWLRGLRKFCTENDILLIIDDIQVGNGRSGYFFSFERADIKPDMVVLSKSISGFGLPMSILLIEPKYDVFTPAEHNGTFRGCNLSFIGGAAAVDYFNNHNLAEKVRRNSEIIKNALEEICTIDSRLKCRGLGMIWGIDFSEISAELAIKCVKAGFANHLILEVAGRNDSVLKIMPPLTIEESILREGLKIIKKVVSEVCREY